MQTEPMTRGYQALTEKEKETLRLLVNGYDAKSMAGHLGLSVHTVNERLRDARRKMAVSSSREAARQLHATESRTPDFLGDKLFGDAAPVAAMEHRHHHERRAGEMRRTRWIIGGVIMSIALAFLAYASLSGGVQTAAQPPAVAAAESAPAQAARRFLELVDKGDWTASWDATGQSFKSVNTPKLWADTSEKVRPPLGALLSRTLMSEVDVPAPPSGYQMVRFKTNYANKREAIETLTLVQEGGSWKITGIYIE